MKSIKEICQKYGLNQTQLAKRFGIPLRTVQNWHEGKREPAPYLIPMIEEILTADRDRKE
jgi:DNA-binding transcriptional regulator YiaG